MGCGLWWPKELCIGWGSRSPKGRCNFGGFWPIEKHWDFMLHITQQRDHSCLSNGSTNAAADCSAPNWQVSHYIFPCEKSVLSPTICLSVCVLDTLLSPPKTTEPVKMLFAGKTCGPSEPCVRCRCTLAPPGEYNGLICVCSVACLKFKSLCNKTTGYLRTIH